VRSFVRYWLPVVAWSVLILSTSNDAFSRPHTQGLMAEFLGRYLTAAQVDTINVCFRKLAHLTAYGILGALGFRGAREERDGYTKRWAIGGVFVAVIVASIDEWHQTTTMSRGGSFADVLLDASGATAAQLLLAWRNARG
jgi:VanZ family protein